jgi:predicted transcriptional regulator
MKKYRPSQQWRDIDDSREWTSYRLAVYRSSLAVSGLLREFRRQGQVSQAAVARWMDVALSTVSNWEAGRSRIPDYRVPQYRRAVIAISSVSKRRKAA